MNVPLPVNEPHRFRDRDFVGGHVALDFLNTVTGREGARRDWLVSFDALLEWATMSGAFTGVDLEAIGAESRQRPDRAASELAVAKGVRQSLGEIFADLLANRAPRTTSVGYLERIWRRALAAGRLKAKSGGIGFDLAGGAGIEMVMDHLVLAAMEMLEHVPSERLRCCDGPNCGWLFLDMSKAGRRRWCDMSTCGNDAKALRYSRKSRQAT